MEYLEKCPVCNSVKDPLPFLSCYDHLTRSGYYQLVRCTDCGLVFTNPRPREESMAEFYKSSAYISHAGQQQGVFQRLYFGIRSFMLGRKAAQIKKLTLPGKRLLDVGCGTGAFAAHMQQQGFVVAGVEPEEAARGIALSKGVYVFEKVTDPAIADGQRFDLITLWHVLEHQPRPIDSLRQYHDLMVAGGFLVIAVPQFESFDGWFYRSSWAAYDLPRHHMHFSRESLLRAAVSTGFKLVRCSGLPFDAFYVSMLSEKSMKNPLRMVRALVVASWSNFLGLLKTRPWSSQVYVFQKTHKAV
jgi:2-polyprenyl-3-methyl-5-hydroxy-6-metoxy-1,4-benzoquinol methylase